MDPLSPKQFLQTCGTIAPLQFEIEQIERRELRRQTLSFPFALVGRDERADICLEDKSVSHRHAYLQVVAGHLWYVDLDSRKGTHGEDGLPAPAPLGLGQRLRIGPYAIRLAGGCRAMDAGEFPLPNPLSSDSFDPSASPQIGLDFLEGAVEQPSWVIDRTLTLVGRGEHCTVRLHSPTVSRTHCALLHTPAGLWMIDLLGREGTCVNGKLVRWALLADANELRIGQFLIRVRQLDQTATKDDKETRRQDDGKRTSVTLSSGLPVSLASAIGGPDSLLPPLVTQFGLMQQQMFDQFQQALMTMAQMFGDLHRDQLQLISQEMDQLHELTRELQGLQTELTRQTPAPREAPPADKPRTTPSPKPSARPRTSAEATSAAPGPSVALSAEGTPPSDSEVHTWLHRRLTVLHQERQTRWQKILQVVAGK